MGSFPPISYLVRTLEQKAMRRIVVHAHVWQFFGAGVRVLFGM